MLQVVLNGLVNGLAIAVVAIAFSVVYVPTRVFFLALAGVYTTVPYLAVVALEAGLPWPVAAVLAAASGTLLAAALDLVNHARLTARRASEGAHLVSSLGMYIVIVQVVALTWGKGPRTLRHGLDTVFRLDDLVITGAQALVAGTGTILIIGFLVLLWRTDLGLRFRAMAANPTQLELLGYDTRHLTVSAFALSGFLASAASLATSFDRGFGPYGGLAALLLGVVAVIVGGRGSFTGPIWGALLLGQVRAVSVWFLSAQWQEVVTFLVLAVLLVFRPQGLVRNETRLEAVP